MRITKRPELHDQQVIAHVVKELGSTLAYWGVTKPEFKKALQNCKEWDGYVLTKYLETNAKQCFPDASMVEYTWKAYEYGHKKRSKLLEAWVKKTKLIPKIPVGTKVRYTREKDIERTYKISSLMEHIAGYVLPDHDSPGATVVDYEELEKYNGYGDPYWVHESVYEARVESYNNGELSIQGEKYGLHTLTRFEFLKEPSTPLPAGITVEVHTISNRMNPRVRKTIVDTLELEQLTPKKVSRILNEAGLNVPIIKK